MVGRLLSAAALAFSLAPGRQASATDAAYQELWSYFPDWDCVLPRGGPIDWNDAYERAVHIGRTQDGEMIWQDGLPPLEVVVLPGSMQECPIGVLCMYVLMFIRAMMVTDRSLAADLEATAKEVMHYLPIHTVAASRWPVFELLMVWSELLLARRPLGEKPSVAASCEGIKTSLDWDELRTHANAMIAARGQGASHDAMVDHARSSAFRQDQVEQLWTGGEAMARHQMECPNGFMFMAVLQAITASNRYSGFAMKWFSIIESYMETMDFELVAGSSWPLFHMLSFLSDLNKQQTWLTGQKGTAKQRRLYGDLGMWPEELIPFGTGQHGALVTEALAATPALVFTEALVPILQAHGVTSRISDPTRWSLIFKNTLASVLSSQQVSPSPLGTRKLAYLTHIWGSTWLPLLQPFVEHFERLGIHNLVVATLDEVAAKKCRAVHRPELCWHVDGRGQLHRLTIMLQLIAFGVDVIYFDLDVFFFTNPAAILLEQAEREGAEMLMSTHYDADCLNNGVMYVRASSNTYRWLLKFTSWYYHHTYENAQRGMNAFLNYSQGINQRGISFMPGDLPVVRHSALEGGIQFAAVCGTGWFGNLADMVAFHWCEAPFDDKWSDLSELYRASAAGDLPLAAARVLEKYKLSKEPVLRQCW